MGSPDETSFIVAYVNCVLKVNANEVFPDQDEIANHTYPIRQDNLPAGGSFPVHLHVLLTLQP